MGEVFQAVRVGPGGFRKPVALKRLPLDASIDAKAVQRFLAEARISAQLDHPNIVRVHDLIEVDQAHYIVMELLRGRNLVELARELRQRGDWPWWIAFAAAEQALAGLQYAHALRDDHGRALGLVHRDLSPRNVFVCEDGVAKVLDFGLAKLRHALTPGLTREGSLQGTLEFLAPEQARGEEADARTDLYQLGATIYWALTDEYPHGTGAAGEVVARVLAGKVRPVAELRPDLPAAAAAVIDRALAPQRAERYADAAAMRAAVKEVLAGAGQATDSSALAAALPPLEAADHGAPAAAGRGGSYHVGPTNGSPANGASASPAATVALRAPDKETPAAAPAAEPAGAPAPTASRLGRKAPLLLIAALCSAAALGAGGFVLGRRTTPPRRVHEVVTHTVPPPSYHRLTFRRGTIYGARFAADGQLIYSARYDDGDTDVFLGRENSPDTRSLDLRGGEVLAVSSAGTIAVLTDVTLDYGYLRRGTLTRANLAGGAPRDLYEDVQWADFVPGGEDLALVRWDGGKTRLEYPAQTTLVARDTGWIGEIRFSPRGDRIAFIDHPTTSDDAGHLSVVDLATRKVTALTPELGSIQGLAWIPGGQAGDRIVFSAAEKGRTRALYSVSLAPGAVPTLIDSGPVSFTVSDADARGRLLVRRDVTDMRVVGVGVSHDDPEVDLSWTDWSYVTSISADGRYVLYGEGASDAIPGFATFLRRTDGRPPVRLWDGLAAALSPDGEYALASSTDGKRLTLVPTRAGEARALFGGQDVNARPIAWFPDSKRFLFQENAPQPGIYVYTLQGDAVTAVPGTSDLAVPNGNPVSPDGQKAILRDARSGILYLVPLAGGERVTLYGFSSNDWVQWAPDAASFYLTHLHEAPLAVRTVDLASKRSASWKKIMPQDPAGVESINTLAMTPDAQKYAFTYVRDLSTLYLVDGVP